MTYRRTLARLGARCDRCAAVRTLHLDTGRHPDQRHHWIDLNRRWDQWLVHPPDP